MKVIPSDIEFIISFEQCTIPKEDWKHKDHLRMAWLYLKREPGFEEAYAKISNGIKKLNQSLGFTTGYHETVTRVFAIYIYKTILVSTSSQTFEEFFATNPWLYDSEKPFRKRHYSDELWKSQEAREHFVLPDLAPLPVI